MVKTEMNQAGKRMLNVKELCAYIGRSRVQAVQWGRDIGAEVRWGRHIVFDRHIIDRELDKLTGQQKEG